MEYLLPHLLRNIAVRFPERQAVRMYGCGLTYAELDRQSQQLSRALCNIGVQRGDRVGIYLHKSLASVVAVFGVLKAGGVYVPLDPHAPAARLAYICRDCDIRILLTGPNKLAGVAELCSEGAPLRAALVLEPWGGLSPPRLPNLDWISWEEVVCQPADGPFSREGCDTDLAYILYTSGSTGLPKGVMIAHRTIFTFLNWCRATFQLGSDDRVTSYAPLHFDLSTFDLYATVAAGGTVVLVPETLPALPVKLVDLLEQERITVTYLVPSILSLMVSYGRLEAHDLSALRLVLFAGEVFPIKYLRRLVTALPQATFYNLYGPTETNVCTYYRVRPEDVAPERAEPVPIGRACENQEVFALSQTGERITEPGVEGELWVRGSGVALGYWGDAERTARSFVQNPLNPVYPDRVYRTGDVVVLAPDRVNWIYRGRRDHMVKSRGYRVELGEIENALYRHEQVKEAVAVAVPDELLGNRIHAFVVLGDGARVTVPDLERFVASVLPKYMVPERIHLCSQLPKTSSGKMDRPTLVAQAQAGTRPA